LSRERIWNGAGITLTSYAQGFVALIGLIVLFLFARIGAALAIKVEDVFVQDRRLWLRLREKGGKRHEMPCHHNLETYLHAYFACTAILMVIPRAHYWVSRRTTPMVPTNRACRYNVASICTRSNSSPRSKPSGSQVGSSVTPIN
jgi:integrase